MDKKKIIIVIGGCDLSHPYFNYISAFEKQKLQHDIDRGYSHIAAFTDGESNIIMAAVIDVNDIHIHINQAGGHFSRMGKYVTAYAEGLAKYMKKQGVTLFTEKPTIGKLAERLGYYLNEFGDYQKDIA